MNEKFYNDQDLIRGDKEQWKAYKSNNNTVVIAGPGSGKTRILTLKAIKLLRTQINPPSGLACISYSRETVRELRKRLKEYGYKNSSSDFIGTIHGFCLIHILQPFGHLFPQYGLPEPFKIASDELRREIYHGVLSDLGIEQEQLSFVDMDRQRSLSANGKSEVEIQTDAFAIEGAKIYDEKLAKTGNIDFIGIVNVSTKMIQEQEYIRRTLEAKFPWLLIDEYQDLGKSLHEMVLDLNTQTNMKIFAVGDMNQSIYGFSGAYPDFLRELRDKDNFEPIALNSNYRSNQDIIEGSLDALSLDPPRPDYAAKKRIDESAEFTFITCYAESSSQFNLIADKVIPKLMAKGIELREIGILVGSGTEVVELAIVLKLRNIPYYIVKWDFQNTDIVYWLQECAQWCLDKDSVSFDELFNFWHLQIKLHNDPRANWEIIRQKKQFYEVLEGCRVINLVAEWLDYFLKELDLVSLLQDSERYPDEVLNLEKLRNEASNRNLKAAELKRFAYLGKPENEVTITTRHSSKGLEFEAVILPGMEEGRFPFYRYEDGSREMREAHRLFYVCISRAKKECILLRSENHTIPTRRGDWFKDFEASRFWKILAKRFANDANVFKEKNYS